MRITSRRERSRWRSKHLFALLLALASLLASCNLRENSLLPPDFDPKRYVEDNTIKVYLDYLVRSENDDAFLYIKKENIADDRLWWGDEIHLRKVGSLLKRDSLAFAQGSVSVTNCYRISIERFGTEVILDSLPGLATLYADLRNEQHLSAAWLVRSQYLLDADRVSLNPYAEGRVLFEIDGNGDLELIDPGSGCEFILEDRDSAVEALYYSETEKLQAWFPQSYLDSAGQTRLRIADSLADGEASSVQGLYPGFTLNTGVLELNTQTPPDYSDPPILHWQLQEQRQFAQEWVRLSQNLMYSWPSGPDTWLVRDGRLVSFLQGPGKYFLLSPLDSQTSLTLPLDGSVSQLFLQDLWLDLRGQVHPGISLRIDPAPAVSSLLSSYFNGSPYSLGASHQACQLEFYQGNSLLETLPGGSWIEFGFRNTLGDLASARLFRVFRSSGSDHIDYKTKGAAYDTSHYSLTSGFVYSGINSSGTFILGGVSENPRQQSFPFLKPEASFQTNRGFVTWNAPGGSFSSLLLEYGTAMPSGHPWLSGQPYQFTSPNALFKITAFNRAKNRTVDLPDNTFIVYKHPNSLTDVVNFSPDESYPRFVWYKAAAAFAHNTFLYQNGELRISPAFSGYLFNAASQSSAAASQLRLYPRMAFDNYDWEYYSDNAQSPSGTPLLNITRLGSVPDSYSILANQYQLSPLAPAYSFAVYGSADFYASQLPYIRIRQAYRPQNLLFSIYEGAFYRIYPYYQSADDDPWHFTYNDGHAGFFLSSNAIYAPMIDAAPHQSVNTTVATNAHDHVVSLYQAQFNLPAALIGTPVPIGTRVNLQEVPDFTAPIPALSAYFLDFRSSGGTQFDPAFYSLIVPSLPYIYIPIPGYVPGQSHRLFYRSLEGIVTEFNFVQSFSATATNEYILVGNCAVGLVDGPGWFYVTN